MALPELWQRIWQALAVDAVLSIQEHGANKLANVQKLCQLSLEYSMQNQGTLTDWLDYVQRLRSAEARETTANLDAADAVQIMTIHKSKGLEFGTVFLPYLNSNTQPDTAEIKYLRGIGLGIKAPDQRGILQNTSVLNKVKKRDKELDLEERKRQLYVAMTRAEDRLIMTGIAGGKDDKTLDELSWFKQLTQIYDKDSVVEIKPILAKDKEASSLEQLTSTAVSKEELENIAPLPNYADKGPRAFSPSSLQTYLHCQRQYFYQYVMGLPPVEEEADRTATAQPAYLGSLSAKDLGSIVHKALEYYKGDLDAALSKATQEVAPLYTGNEARRMLEGYLASDLYKRIPKKTLREQAFTIYADNGIVLSGIIDCLGIQPDGSLLLVDYKTGRPPVAGAINKGYAYQLAIYEKVVRERWAKGKGEPPKLTAELHFLRNNTAWNLESTQAGLAVDQATTAYGQQTKPVSEGAENQAPNYYAEALALCAEISKKSAESEFACKEQKYIKEAQNVAGYADNNATTQANAKNIAKGVAACDYCPYNYVCNHK